MILHITDENHFVGVLGPVRGSETIGLAKNAHCLSGLTPSITVTIKRQRHVPSNLPLLKMFSNLTVSSGSATCEPLEKQPQRWDQEVFRRRHHRRGSLVPLLRKHHCGIIFSFTILRLWSARWKSNWRDQTTGQFVWSSMQCDLLTTSARGFTTSKHWAFLDKSQKGRTVTQAKSGQLDKHFCWKPSLDWVHRISLL